MKDNADLKEYAHIYIHTHRHTYTNLSHLLK